MSGASRSRYGKLEERPLHDQAYEEKIIDLDFHLEIPHSMLLPYVRDSRIRELVAERGVPPTGNKTTTLAYAESEKPADPLEHSHGKAVKSDEIREICDELAIDIPIVQPGTVDLPLTTSNYPMVQNALVRAYNDYLLDRVVDVDDDVYATLMVPHWDVEFAVEELDRVGDERGFVAAQNYMITDKLWGDPDFDPILEKLSDMDLNLVLHIGESGFGPKTDTRSTHTHTEHMVYGYGYTCVANALNLIMSGVFDFYPDLEVSLQETGTLWMPMAAYRMDEEYLSYPTDVALVERFYKAGKEDLDRLPSEYVFDNLYCATQPVELPNIPRQHVEGLLRACQPERTWQYTSDWPHQTLDPANWVFDEPSIDADLRARILHGNAEDFLRFP